MIDIDIEARRGSLDLKIKCRIETPWTVIFGPSGAGKTTLLRLIAGLDNPSAGLVTSDPPASVGMVSQHSALFPHISVGANVAYGIAHVPRQQRQERVQAMLELVDASSLAGRLPWTLSGGEAQRVALARALAPAPRHLLLDEPLSALDGLSRDTLLTRLQSWLKEQAMQTVLVTHDAADALATSAEVLMISRGKLVAQGAASEILAIERERILARLQTVANS